MSTEQIYTFRPYIADDVPFIHNSWGMSYYAGNNGHRQLTSEEFHKYHRPIRDKILTNPLVAGIVCVPKGDDSTILGWVLVEKPERGSYLKMHYIYVKGAVTGEGIGTELLRMALPTRPVLYTHSTIKAGWIIKENWKLKKNFYERFIFTPHLI